MDEKISIEQLYEYAKSFAEKSAEDNEKIECDLYKFCRYVKNSEKERIKRKYKIV